MIKRVLVEKLQPGMFVIDSGLGLSENSGLYSVEGEIRSADQVAEIAARGYVEAFVDSAKGSYYRLHPQEQNSIQVMYAGLQEPEPKAPAPQRSARPRTEPTVPLTQEIKRMEKIYVRALDLVKNFLKDFKDGGQVDLNSCARFVDEILESQSRNPKALTALIKLRGYDDYSYTHCLNVAVLAVGFGRHLRLPDETLRILGLGGLFHDVGKLRVSLSVLNKPGKLTEQEYGHVKRHPAYSCEMLEELEGLDPEVARIAKEHHEKFSGQGYPEGLPFASISKSALIVALADVYDALTSERPYKGALSQHQALGIMYAMRNKDFHPVLVDKFIKFLGVYPLGTLVKLRNGLVGVVNQHNGGDPMRPTVKVLQNGLQAVPEPQLLSLSQQEFVEDSQYQIVECLAPGALRLDPVALMA